MAHSGCIFRARSQCSIHKTWGTQSCPEGRVVYLICPTKPADPHFWGFVPHSRDTKYYFYTLWFFIQVLRQIIYGYYGWYQCMNYQTCEMTAKWLLLKVMYDLLFYFLYNQRFCSISINTMSKMCHFILRKQGKNCQYNFKYLYKMVYSHFYIKIKFLLPPITAEIEDFLFQTLIQVAILWLVELRLVQTTQ
jgi:hypothetical protein